MLQRRETDWGSCGSQSGLRVLYSRALPIPASPSHQSVDQSVSCCPTERGILTQGCLALSYLLVDTVLDQQRRYLFPVAGVGKQGPKWRRGDWRVTDCQAVPLTQPARPGHRLLIQGANVRCVFIFFLSFFLSFF